MRHHCCCFKQSGLRDFYGDCQAFLSVACPVCFSQLCPSRLSLPVSQLVSLECSHCVFLTALSRCNSHTVKVTTVNNSVILHKSRVVRCCLSPCSPTIPGDRHRPLSLHSPFPGCCMYTESYKLQCVMSGFLPSARHV